MLWLKLIIFFIILENGFHLKFINEFSNFCVFQHSSSCIDLSFSSGPIYFECFAHVFWIVTMKKLYCEFDLILFARICSTCYTRINWILRRQLKVLWSVCITSFGQTWRGFLPIHNCIWWLTWVSQTFYWKSSLKFWNCFILRTIHGL